MLRKNTNESLYAHDVLFYYPGDQRDLHVLTLSFPTRLSADLSAARRINDAGRWACQASALRGSAYRLCSPVGGFAILSGCAISSAMLVPRVCDKGHYHI